MQHIKDIMTRNPKTCLMSDKITKCLEIMSDENCGAVPIVDKNRTVQGIITDRDIALCLLENSSQSAKDLSIQECVKVGHVITCKPEDTLHHAIELMEKNQVRRLPVIDDQHKCVGIVAQADIVLKDKNKEEAIELVREISKAKMPVSV